MSESAPPKGLAILISPRIAARLVALNTEIRSIIDIIASQQGVEGTQYNLVFNQDGSASLIPVQSG